MAIVDWKDGIMSDFYSTVMSGGETNRSMTDDFLSCHNGVRIVRKPLYNDTYPQEYETVVPAAGNGFGFHIVKGNFYNQKISVNSFILELFHL